MNAFWSERSERERMLLLAAAAIFSLAILYYLIAAPLGRWREDAAKAAARAETTYMLVREAAATGASEASGSGGGGQTPVRNALLQSARPNGIALNFVNPHADGTVQAGVDAVDPERLFQWLSILNDTHGVEALSADIARESDSPRLVRAQFVFGSK